MSTGNVEALAGAGAGQPGSSVYDVVLDPFCGCGTAIAVAQR